MILADSNFDVLVVAGDISNMESTRSLSLVELASTANPKPVVYVLGNHEAYGGTLEEAEAKARKATATCGNLHVLEREVAEIAGQRFVGCTLWYEYSGWVPLDDRMGDFTWIDGIRSWLPERAKESAKFLRETVQPGDVVVTHTLPHVKSIHSKYRHSPTNNYFLHNVGDVVEKGGAKLWVHGHTHASVDYRVGETRVVCNPFGYVHTRLDDEPNLRFNPKFTVEL